MKHRSFSRMPLARRLSLALLAGLLPAGCSHLNPFERAEYSKSHPEAVERLLAHLPAEAPEPEPAFVGSVAAGLHEADTLRYALLKSASEMSNERAAYDTLLWTLGPYLLYRAVNGGPSSKDAVQRGATVLAAGYGFLKARPKEYEEIFYRGANRMSCLMIDNTRYLYTAEELALPEGSMNHSALAKNLQAAIIEYSARSSEVFQETLYIPPPKSTVTCAVGGSACRDRRAQLESGAPNRSNEAKEILEEANARINWAQANLTALEDLNSELRSEARNRMSFQSRRLMESVRAELLGRRPDIASVSDILPIIQQSMDKLVQVKVAQAQNSGSPPKQSKPTDGRLIQIPSGVSKALRDDFLRADRALQQELSRTQIILAVREQKNRSTDAFYRQEGCPAVMGTGVSSDTRGSAGGGTPATTPDSIITPLPNPP